MGYVIYQLETCTLFWRLHDKHRQNIPGNTRGKSMVDLISIILYYKLLPINMTTDWPPPKQGAALCDLLSCLWGHAFFGGNFINVCTCCYFPLQRCFVDSVFDLIPFVNKPVGLWVGGIANMAFLLNIKGVCNTVQVHILSDDRWSKPLYFVLFSWGSI